VDKLRLRNLASDPLLARSGFLLARFARVGMTMGAMSTFEGSTFVGVRSFWNGTILLTGMGWGEMILV
jgi:hypothetical protein